MLNRLLKKSVPAMVGIDIGSHSVKAVLLTQQDQGYRLDAVAIEPMPKGAMAERNIQDIEAIGRVIAKLRRRIPKSISHAVVAVSGQTVITKVIFMDVSLSDAELESQIEIEADSLIPYPLDEVSIDFESSTSTRLTRQRSMCCYRQRARKALKRVPERLKPVVSRPRWLMLKPML